MIDADDYIEKLEIFNPLTEPLVCSAIRALRLPPASRGLDAGCGIGLQALRLADEVGSGGHVTCLDITNALLVHAEKISKKAGRSKQISFQAGDVRNIPFADGTFDWAWSSCCVGYAASIEPIAAVKELARVVKPGGIVSLFAWTSEKLLPGYPLLEARLQATSSGIAPFAAGMRPELHFSRALGWFREAGLGEPAAQTFAGGAFAPLSNALRNALAALFEMRWPNLELELTEEDRSEFQRLCLPDSPEFILNHPDYFAFFTCSLFFAKVAD
jgi:ubiquinone/menaquinone biosynthesis C-methylase UbiE